MSTNRAMDVLLVGSELFPCVGVAVRAGLTAASVPTCLDAIARLARAEAKVVVLSGRDIEGRQSQALSALTRGVHRPSVLLTVPPRQQSPLPPECADCVEGILPEPCLPATVIDRVKAVIASRSQESEEGHGSEPDRLKATIDDLATLNEKVPSLEVLKDDLFQMFVRRSSARRASLLSRLTVKESGMEREVLFIERARGLPEGVEIGTCLPLDQGIAGRVAETGTPLLLSDVHKSPFAPLANQGPYRTHSCMSIPLKVKDRLLGVINLADREDNAPFSESEFETEKSFADHAARILLNARRLERMTRLSIIDDLTGLYNRRFFRKSLEREFKRAVRYQRPLTLAILDVDHFKTFNDKNGHEGGNQVLARLGDIFRRSFRNTDIVARYGGEEFAVIFPEIEKGSPGTDGDPSGAYRVLERLRRRIEDTAFPGEEILPGGRLTISGGAACYPIDARSVSDILVAADSALYRAKHSGRNLILLSETVPEASGEEE